MPATQTVEFFAAPSQTMTAKLFAAGSDTQVASVAATEATNRKGVYTAAYTDVAAGTYRLLALVGTTPVASWWVDLTLTTATFVSYEVPLGVFNSGDAAQATLLAVKAKTDLITSGNISVLQDRVNDNTITMQYNENTSATVNLDEDTTSATLQFVVARPDGTDVLTIANGAITRTSSDFTVTITTAVTATIGQYLWSLRDLTGGGNRVVSKGVLTVQNAAAIDA